jgi:hypothetical protein
MNAELSNIPEQRILLNKIDNALAYNTLTFSYCMKTHKFHTGMKTWWCGTQRGNSYQEIVVFHTV